MPDVASRTLPPTINRTAGDARLFVDGEPFLVRGIELHNSSSSDPDHFRHGLDTAASVNANTVLAAIGWDAIEPEEGVFDFTQLDVMIDETRAAGLRLVILWFGAWKNGGSSYAPTWVKRDTARFPRCRLEDGTITDTLTPFGDGELDLVAFLSLIAHVETRDVEHRTVIMVQIENEIGLLGGSRDRSGYADREFANAIPDAVAEALDTPKAGVTWSDLERDPMSRDELFMAAGYARHVEKLASAAREITPLPFFVNAWLDSNEDAPDAGFAVAGGQEPGTYPSGGPLPRVAEAWATLAPTLSLFGADIYFGNPDQILTRFRDMGRGIIVPEQRTDAVGAGLIFLAIAEYGAVGTSPFGADSRSPEELVELRDAYRLLSRVEHLLPAGSHRNPTRGFTLRDYAPTAALDFGDVMITISRFGAPGVDQTGRSAYGLVIRLSEDTFVFAGRGFRATLSASADGIVQHIGRVDELSAANDQTLRLLNGDETLGGTSVVHPPLERQLGEFPIAMGHAHSGLSRLVTYVISGE